MPSRGQALKACYLRERSCDLHGSKAELIASSRSLLRPARRRIAFDFRFELGFDELLIFFWAPVFAQSMHLRVPVCLLISDAKWQAPVLIDLMTMPGAARAHGHQPSDHKRASFPAAKRTENGLLLDALELRDYPQVLKLIRVTGP